MKFDTTLATSKQLGLLKQAERMAFLFAMSQGILALGLFWALKAHLV